MILERGCRIYLSQFTLYAASFFVMPIRRWSIWNDKKGFPLQSWLMPEVLLFMELMNTGRRHSVLACIFDGHKRNMPALNDKLTPEEFSARLRQIMTHMTTGEIKKGRSFGIHFFKTSHHRIAEIIRPANEKGIWEARIEVRHPNTNAWVSKKKSSTLFPTSWTESKLAEKLKEAYHNSIQNNSHKKFGTTSCGIKVAFIFQDGEIASCYPVYE